MCCRYVAAWCDRALAIRVMPALLLSCSMQCFALLMLSQNKCPQRCRALEYFGSSENAIQDASRNCVAGRLRVLRHQIMPACPAQGELLDGQPTFGHPHCRSGIWTYAWVLPRLHEKKSGTAPIVFALMTALALLPCLRPETSSWAGSGCTGRHDGPATARSKGAVPSSTGASNSKLSATNC